MAESISCSAWLPDRPDSAVGPHDQPPDASSREPAARLAGLVALGVGPGQAGTGLRGALRATP